jgi:hypothetical protein
MLVDCSVVPDGDATLDVTVDVTRDGVMGMNPNAAGSSIADRRSFMLERRGGGEGRWGEEGGRRVLENVV